MSEGVTGERTISSKMSVRATFCFGFILKVQFVEIFEKISKGQQ